MESKPKDKIDILDIWIAFSHHWCWPYGTGGLFAAAKAMVEKLSNISIFNRELLASQTQKWISKSALRCQDWIRLSVEYIKVCIVLGLGDSPTLGEVNLVATTSPNNRRLVSSTLCTHASLPHTLVQYLLFGFSLCSSVTILLL